MGKTNQVKKARVIAFYLPQFHPIPLNDATWGKGFTEWTNVAQAKPLFKGHYQPRIPTDLGFYDLRLPQTRIEQANLARNAGVEGFMYWHYWFGNGKMALERPLEEVIKTGQPDFPFCYGWANHSWTTKTWKKGKVSQSSEMIVEQLYPGEEDNIKHFYYCLTGFRDKRYITIDGKPLFVIYSPQSFPKIQDFINQWQRLAKENGLPGLYIIGLWYDSQYSYQDMMDFGLDGMIRSGRADADAKVAGGKFNRRIREILANKFGIFTQKYDYGKILNNMYFEENKISNCYPIIMPGYDRTARAGKQARVYTNPTPKAFQNHIHNTLKYIKNKKDEHKLIFLDSWNEWAEGNYMEPDSKWGHAFLEALKNEIL